MDKKTYYRAALTDGKPGEHVETRAENLAPSGKRFQVVAFLVRTPTGSRTLVTVPTIGSDSDLGHILVYMNERCGASGEVETLGVFDSMVRFSSLEADSISIRPLEAAVEANADPR